MYSSPVVEESSLKAVADSPTFFLKDVDSSRIVKLDWQSMCALCTENPEGFCNVICDAVGLNKEVLLSEKKESEMYSVFPGLFDPLPSATDKNSSDKKREKNKFTSTSLPTLFDVICSSLFGVDPRRIIKIVHVLARSNVAPTLDSLGLDASSHSVIALKVISSRALRSLAPVSLLSPDPDHDGISSGQVCTTAALLEFSGRPLDAMVRLLRHKEWDEALNFLDRVKAKGPSASAVSSQLFQAMLHQVLICQETKVLTRLWDYIPDKMTALDLVQILKEDLSHNVESPSDSNEMITLEMIKPALKILLEKQ